MSSVTEQIEIDWSTQWWIKHDMSSFFGRF
jgi:hypothetical protein